MKSTLLLSVLLALSCGMSSFGGFSKYVPITTSGFSGNAVSDFPLLVKIDATKVSNIYSDVKNAGMDLKFTDVTGATEYPYDVDVWNPSGTSLVWVKVPSLSSTTSFRMYYGDSEKTTNPGSVNVWSAYHGVWHLNSDLKDSGENGYDGTDCNTVGSTTGAIGTGWTISNSETAGDRVGAIAMPTSHGLQQGNTFTWTGWVKTSSTSAGSTEFMCPIAKRPLNCWKNSPATCDGGFAYLWNGDWVGRGFLCAYGHGKGQLNCFSGSKLLNDGNWHYVVIAAADGVFDTYYDGIRILNQSSVSQGKFTDNTNYPLVFGNESSQDSTLIGTAELPWDSTNAGGWQGKGSAWKGSIDEYRMFKTVRSADEVKADYLVATTDVTEFGEPQDLSDYSVTFQAQGSVGGFVPHTVTFNAQTTGFTKEVTFNWDFDNDGIVDLSTTESSVSYTYTSRGSHTVKVTAVDEDDHQATAKVDDYIRAYGSIYVDANVATEGAGTQASPFKTITNAVAHAMENETIYLRGGTDRVYSIARCDGAVIISDFQHNLTIQGCGEDWSLPTGWSDTNKLAVIGLSDTYAKDSKTLTGSASFNAPFEILATDCTIRGVKCEYGKYSFKQQNQGGTGLINVSADGFTLEDSFVKMSTSAGGYESAGCNGILYGKANAATKMRFVGCYIECGYYRCALMPLYNGLEGSGLINCFVKNTATVFSSQAQATPNLYIISNTFYNCKNEDSGYVCWLIDCGANSYPGGGEVAYNRAIHDDGSAKRYRFMQHGRQYAGSWNNETKVHHNTIVGYESVFETPYNSNKQYSNTWQPLIFDNLILCPQGTNIVEHGAQNWEYQNAQKQKVSTTTSYRPGSEFRCNAVQCDTFLAGDALTLIPNYDITEGLAYTNTTITLTAAPEFVNTSEPASPDFYRVNAPAKSWAVIGGYTYDNTYPAYIGAVEPLAVNREGLLILIR